MSTVTDTSVIITWFTGSATAMDEYGFPAPVATDSELRLAPFNTTTLTAGTYRTVYHDSTPTAYHYAEVNGLEPGTAYAYQALSNGQVAVRTAMQFPVGAGGSLDYANVFETLTTPPGTYLFTLALSNDLHIGEGTSGLIENGWPPAFSQDPGLPAYPVVMLDDGQNPIESIEFLEVGATKEYPGGYSLVRLYTGGYMVSYYKLRSTLALAWAQRSRHEYYSLYPHYMLGTIADRNHTVVRDLSGLTPLTLLDARAGPGIR